MEQRSNCYVFVSCQAAPLCSAGDAPLEDGKSDRKTIGKKLLEMERLDRKRLEKRGLEELRLYRKWRYFILPPQQFLLARYMEQSSNCYLFVSCQAAPLFD